jgi:hypothetical protein
MNLSDKAHLRESARRGECTPEYAEQLIREAEQAEAMKHAETAPQPEWTT